MRRRRNLVITLAGAAAVVLLASVPAGAVPEVHPATAVTGGKVTVVMDRALVAAMTADGVSWAATDGARVTETGSSVIWTFAAEPSREVNLAYGAITVELVGGMEFVGQGLRKDFDQLRVSITATSAMLEGQQAGTWLGIAILGQAKVPSKPTGKTLRIKPFEVFLAPGTFMVMTDDGYVNIAPSTESIRVFGAIGMKLKVK